MTGVNIGMNLKYLPWQLSTLIMFGLSIVCIYGAIKTNGKGKVIKIVFICLAIMIFLTGIKALAINIGMFAQCLPFLNPLIYSILGITMFLILWDS